MSTTTFPLGATAAPECFTVVFGLANTSLTASASAAWFGGTIVAVEHSAVQYESQVRAPEKRDFLPLEAAPLRRPEVLESWRKVCNRALR